MGAGIPRDLFLSTGCRLAENVLNFEEARNTAGCDMAGRGAHKTFQCSTGTDRTAPLRLGF